MTALYIPDFWPNLLPGQLRRFDYTDATNSMPPFTSVFAYDVSSHSMLLVDYDAHLTWKDTWYYQNQPGKGIVEWRDDYPGKKVVMSPGIGWGENISIGQDLITYPKMDPLRSWPPSLASGIQICHFEEFFGQFYTAAGAYNEVLQFTYLQSWNGKPGTGARYWMAKGIGPVAVQWLAQDPTNPQSAPLIQTARMDATITEVGGLSA